MGKLTEAVQRMLSSLQISSASPGHINEVLQTDISIDLDEALGEAQEELNIKQDVQTAKAVEKINKFDKGQVGEIQRFSRQQFGNIKQVATNPGAFFIAAVFKKLPKVISRGGPIGILILFIEEVVRFAINELLKPGRLLDRRFKRNIEKELLQFRRRQDQQKLKQGITSIIITTMPRLRGGVNQVYNTLDDVRNNSIPLTIGQDDILASGVSFSKNKGTPGRRFGS